MGRSRLGIRQSELGLTKTLSLLDFCAFLMLRLPGITDLNEGDTVLFFSPFLFKISQSTLCINELFCYHNWFCRSFNGMKQCTDLRPELKKNIVAGQ